MYHRVAASEGWVPLLLRIGVGLTFLFAGLGKVLGGVSGFAGFLGSLGVPLAGVAGPLVAYLELLGGLLLLLGLFTRPLSALLLVNMLVAMMLVSIPGWLGAENGIIGGFGQIRAELLLALSCVALLLSGAGPYSLDAVIFGRRAAQGSPALGSPAR